MRWLSGVLKRLGILGTVLGIPALVSTAEACSLSQISPVFFDYKSAGVVPSTTKSTLRSLQRFQSVGSKCWMFRVSVISHPEETEAGNDLLGVKRAEAAKNMLVDAGFPVGNIEARHRIGDRKRPPDPLGWDHRAEVDWAEADGVWRCDPESRNENANPAACERKYACYLELSDGTVCNFYNVPDPNGRRYSLIR